jgi:outer membrane protein OmpA-like peptidoglycan-associated protein
MADQDDDVNRRAGLWVVFSVVTLVVLGVLGFAVMRTLSPRAPAAPQMAMQALGEPALRLYFEVGSATLPADAADLLAQVAQEARTRPARVVISGFHDESGDPARNAELARERAQAVEHALQSNGLTADRLELRKPAVTAGGGDPREARRVELHLQ